VHAASADDLRAAIAAVKRALGMAHERDEVFELVRERAALRRDLQSAEGNESARRRERVA
jgi:hypothetical protein